MAMTGTSSTLSNLPVLLKMAKALKPRPESTHDCLGARLETTAARFPEHTAIIFEGRTLNWREFNALANRYASALREIGLVRGDAVALLMENRIEYLAIIAALNKLGITAALVNTNLTGRSLSHCISITSCRMCIFGEERAQPIAEVRSDAQLGKDRE